MKMVRVSVPKNFEMLPGVGEPGYGNGTVKYVKGVYEMPAEHALHWYAKIAGVIPLDPIKSEDLRPDEPKHPASESKIMGTTRSQKMKESWAARKAATAAKATRAPQEAAKASEEASPFEEILPDEPFDGLPGG